MENNPVKLLFNLTQTSIDTMHHAISKGIVIAPTAKSDERKQICYNCPDLDKASIRCKLCGCYMSVKVHFDAAKCPAGKW